MRKKILVVDDTDFLADDLSRVLQYEGHEVVTRYDPESAIQELAKGKFDGVITDKEMHGDRDAGFKVAAAARNANPEASIVLISGGVSEALLPVVQKKLQEIGGDTQFVDKNDIMGWVPNILAIVNGQQRPAVAGVVER